MMIFCIHERFTLVEAMSATERWVWMLSSCSRHQSSSSRVSNDSRAWSSSANKTLEAKTVAVLEWELIGDLDPSKVWTPDTQTVIQPLSLEVRLPKAGSTYTM